MCIIAIQPQGVKIKENILKNCWDANNDGVGIMYSDNGKIIVNREMHSFNEFMKLKKQADKLNTNIVIHFRIATSGGVNEHNCHPFKVNDNVYFCHNGILDIKVPTDSKINDTQIFNNAFMRGLDANFVQNDTIMQLLEYSIGNRNKFVFLDSQGQFYILNENAGTWDSGAWFSNNSYKSSPYQYYKPNKKWNTKPFSEIVSNIDDNEELMECESCNELHFIDNMVHDNYFDMLLCKSCNEYCVDIK